MSLFYPSEPRRSIIVVVVVVLLQAVVVADAEAPLIGIRKQWDETEEEARATARPCLGIKQTKRVPVRLPRV